MGSPLPFSGSGRSATLRNIHYNTQHKPIYVSGVVDATYAYDGGNTSYEQVLRAGTIMAQITATKQWLPCKRTQVNMADATTTALVVDDARAFQAGDTITIGSDTDVAVSAVNYATNTLTIASTAVADNEVVFCDKAGQEGCEIARAILDETDGLDLIDDDTNTATDRQTSRLLVNGYLRRAMILGDIAAVEAVTNYLGDIRFDTTAGQV